MKKKLKVKEICEWWIVEDSICKLVDEECWCSGEPLNCSFPKTLARELKSHADEQMAEEERER